MTTVESQTEDPSTSVDSFGKMTGLLSNEGEEATESMKVVSRRPSTTTERSEQDNEAMVHTHSEVVVPMKTNTVTKLTIIPGTVKQTKVYMNAPKKPMMMMMTSSNDNAEERLVQLDQGSTLLLFLLAALLFCACLMASIVAIVSSLREAARPKSIRHTVSSFSST